jgi:hypothetical protein
MIKYSPWHPALCKLWPVNIFTIFQPNTDLTGPENDVPLGTDEIDIPAILTEANKIGIKHYFIEDESNYVNVQVPQSIRYLKSLAEQ